MIGNIDKLFDSLADLLAPEVAETTMRLERICESPIEVALGTALLWTDRILAGGSNPLILCWQGAEEDHYGPDARLLMPQYQWENRRIDWVLRDGPSMTVFIECDGHDFHERTKEQAARDRRKDRDAQRVGYPILRFTGSEIYRDPVACANEVFATISEFYICGRRTA